MLPFDPKKFDLVNPVIGKLATQVRASKLTDYELTKKILNQGEIEKLRLVQVHYRQELHSKKWIKC